MRFNVVPTAEFDRYRELEALPPFSPYNTARYAAARTLLGEEAFVCMVEDGRALVAGCIAILVRGRLSSRLRIPSVPRPSDAALFFDGVKDFCQRKGVWVVEIGSRGSDWPGPIPPLGHEIFRNRPREYVLSLTGEGIGGHLSTNHRRNIARAVASGIGYIRRSDEQAVAVHLSAVKESMDRRASRNERIYGIPRAAELTALLRSGVAEVHQSVLGAKVLSSSVVLRSPRVAYYQSAGTTRRGRKCGASTFLVHRVAQELGREGVTEFNLGIANPDNPGLERFKSGFGGATRESVKAGFALVSPLGRILLALLSMRH